MTTWRGQAAMPGSDFMIHVALLFKASDWSQSPLKEATNLAGRLWLAQLPKQG